MTVPTGKLTKRAIDSLRAGERDQFLWDDELKGFGLKLTPKGARSYVFQFRLGGREANVRRYTIGRHGSPWTPASARQEAIRIAHIVATGADPTTTDRERRRVAIDLAFDAYSARFLDDCAGVGWRRMVERTLRLYATPLLAAKPMPAIRRADITSILDRIPSNQVALRRNTFAVLRRLFRWAVGRGDLERSPCDGMYTPPAVVARERVLTETELVAVWKATDSVGNLFGPIVKMLIATGQRREEVAGLSWNELDRATATWTLPRQRAKNSTSHMIPLNKLALDVLDSRAGGRRWPERGFVFATSGGKSFIGHARGKRQMDEQLTKSNGQFDPWRLHDLRRTLATGLQRLGHRFEVVEAVLNHVGSAKAGVAGIYQRHDWADEKRLALADWAASIECLMNRPENKDNVIDLASART